MQKTNGKRCLADQAGDYRIIYEIYDEVLRITVIEIDHRRQVYRS